MKSALYSHMKTVISFERWNITISKDCTQTLDLASALLREVQTKVNENLLRIQTNYISIW